MDRVNCRDGDTRVDESERFVSTAMGKIAVTVSGDCGGSVVPLVMWPSLLMDHSLWSRQVSYFAGRVPTICVDPPGHGRSAPLVSDFELEDCAAVLEAILDEFGVARAHLAGNSWGAMTSAVFGAMFPDRTASLVLITGTAGTASLAQRLQFRSLLAIAKATGGIPSALNGQLVRIFFAPGIERRNPGAVQQMLSQVAQREPVSVGHAARSVVVNRRDRHDLYTAIAAPTVVISGQHDRIFPPADGRRLASAIPDARFVVVPDAAHLLAAEVPDVINNLIDDHITEALQHG